MVDFQLRPYFSIWMIVLSLTLAAMPESQAGGIPSIIKSVRKRLLGHSAGDDLRRSFKGAAQNDIVTITKELDPLTKDVTEFVRKFAPDGDLVRRAQQGGLPEIIGGEEELEGLITVLNGGKNPVIVGESGVGKTTTVYKLAQLIAFHPERVPEKLRGKRVIAVNINLFTAGVERRGDAQGRLASLEKIIMENPDVIFFFDEMHILAPKSENSNEFDYLGGLKGILRAASSSEPRVIGTSTIEEYRRHIERDEPLANRFMTIEKREPSLEEAVEITTLAAGELEIRHGIIIPPEAISAAVKMCKKMVSNKALPLCPKELLEVTASRVEIEKLRAPRRMRELNAKKLELQETIDKFRGSVKPTHHLLYEQAQESLSKVEHELLQFEKSWNEFLPQLNKFRDEIEKVRSYADYFNGQFQEIINDQPINETEIKRTLDQMPSFRDEVPLTEKLEQAIELAENLKQKPLTGSDGTAELSNLIDLLKADVDQRRIDFNQSSAYTLRDEVTMDDLAQALRFTYPNLREDYIKSVLDSKGFVSFVKDLLDKKVVGQKHVIKQVLESISMHMRGLSSNKGSSGQFLFSGLSRIGKTFFAQVLGEAYGAFMKIDGRDLMQKHQISTYFGAPPGFVGFQQGGTLLNFVKKHRSAVILLDEFEKMHPEVRTILLSLRDDPIIEDNKGRRVDFSNVVFVITTNTGAKVPSEFEGVVTRIEDLQGRSHIAALRKLFTLLDPQRYTPEFMNGLTGIFRFKGFSEVEKSELVRKIFDNEMHRSFLSASEIHTTLSDRLVDKVAMLSEGGDATRIKASIDEMIAGPLNRFMDEAKLEPGDMVEIDLEEGGQEKVVFKIINENGDTTEQVDISTNDDLREILEELVVLEEEIERRAQMEFPGFPRLGPDAGDLPDSADVSEPTIEAGSATSAEPIKGD